MQVPVVDLNRELSISLLSRPDECPYCHKIVEPWPQKGSLYINEPDILADVPFRCTNRDCRRLFVATYRHQVDEFYKFVGIATPRKKPGKEFPDSIKQLSPSFIDIYSQANIAEQDGLDQIAGLGYRRALEFLIKDYLIQRTPADEQDIKKSMLGNCISQRIDDVRIKEMSRRATWLGNDEAHYVRKWVGKDISDLKVLIQLIVHLIEQQHLYESYMAEMPS